MSDAFIVDIFAAPRDEATWSALFDAALQWADAKGAATIRTLAPEQGLLEGKLRAAAFQLGAGRYDVSAVALQGDGFPSPMQSAQRWFTTAGDYDVL